MLIKKVREFDRAIGAKVTCPYCTNPISGPPALLLTKNKAVYHPECAMQLTYEVLADLSGYAPDPHLTNQLAEEPELSGMAQAFRAARRGAEIPD